MSIDELGSIGEFIASIGVIVSLVYLALQTKANTSAVKAQTRSSLTDQVLGIQSQMFQSDAYRIAFQKSVANVELNSLDQDILRREALLFFKHLWRMRSFSSTLGSTTRRSTKRNEAYGRIDSIAKVFGLKLGTRFGAYPVAKSCFERAANC